MKKNSSLKSFVAVVTPLTGRVVTKSDANKMRSLPWSGKGVERLLITNDTDIAKLRKRHDLGLSKAYRVDIITEFQVSKGIYTPTAKQRKNTFYIY